MNYLRKNKGFLRAFLNVFVMVSLVSQVALAPLSVVHADSTSTCNVTTTETINPGDTVEWTASLSGSGDTVEFTWSGDDGLSGSTETVSKTYTTSGTKSATVSVKAIGSSTSTICDGITYVITPGANTPPVITVVGDNPQTITIGSAYTELGATATDVEDGDLTGDIVTDSSAVDTATLGDYTVTYNVVDSGGLAADEKTRTVSVVAAPVVNTAPVITLVGDNPQILTIGDAYTELGATANDAEDGDITADVVTDSSTVNMAVVGDYVVTYNVVDSGGLAATEVTRTVRVIPATSAVCTISVTTTIDGQAVVWSTPELPAGENPKYSWSGDDGLSGSTATTTHVYATAGTYEGTVIVTGDTSASCSIATDLNTPPTITLIGNNPLSIVIGDTFVDPGATAFDIEDGDLTGDIVVTGTVGTSTGNYVLVYSVTDSDGNTASVNRTVTVTPIASCEASEFDSATLTATATKNAPFTHTITATSTDGIDGYEVATSTLPAGLTYATSTDGIVISGTPTENGTFGMELLAVNTCATTTASFVLTVSGGGGGGGGNTPPTITLIGSSTINIFVGDDYIDQGATAFDAEDGDITANIVATSTVATTTVGTYGVDYSVTDSGGLTAATSRTVIVNPLTCTAPSMTSSGTASATKGQNFEYDLSFTPSATTTTVTVDSATLPAGLSFSTTTNKITGVPTDVGTFTVAFNLENDCGDTDVEVIITVSAAPCTTCGGGGGGGGGGSSSPTLDIFNEVITPILDNSAIITWNTNNPATSRVVYGTTTIASPDAALPNYGYRLSTVTLSPLVTSHSMGVTFEPGVKYYFRPISTAGGLTAVGKELTITFEAPTTCSYLRDFLRIDFDNDPQEVIKLQAYLNSFEGETLDVNGIFDQETLEATNRYQDKYFGQILSPWGHEEHTGYVYILTKKHINETYCKTAYPLTVLEEQEIDAFRALLESLRNAGVDNGGETSPADIGNTISPDVNDGTIGLGDGNATSTDNGGNLATGNGDGVVAGTTTPETGFATTLTNLAGVLFAFPDSVQEGVVCAGWLALILLVVYLLGTLLVNILSRDEAVSERELRIRKLATYIVGLVYAFIPVLIFDLNCITLPLALIIGIIVLFIIYLVVKEAKTKKVNY